MSGNTKKKKNLKTGQTKNLRQTTLFESVASSSPRDVPSPQKTLTPRKPGRKRGSESSESSDIAAVRLEPVTPAKGADDQDDRSQSPLPSRTKKRRRLAPETETDEEHESSRSDSGVAVKPRGRRLRRLAVKSSSSSCERSPSQTRFTSKEKAKKVTLNAESDEELADEVDEDRIIEPRLRTRSKQTAFQKNLDRLKRKRTRRSVLSSESSDDSEEDEEETQAHSKPFKGARPASGEADVLSDDDTDGSSDFIIEDDGQAAIAQLPTEFSMRSHDDLSHQFKIIFQFFVHIAVRPAPHRRAFMEDQIKHQEYFSVPLKAARRKLSGIRDSLVASSVWLPKFKNALGRHPTFELIPLDFAVPSCDACRLGGRMSTLMGRLGGIPYDNIGFKDQITSSSSEEDSSDVSEGSKNYLKKSKFGFIEFHLGKFCARRVRTYHEFSHWEYHLFNSIRSELDDLHAARSKKGFVRVAFAGGKQPPDDLTDADGVCEWLDERGVIDQEWRKVKTMMEDSQRLEVSAKKGEED